MIYLINVKTRKQAGFATMMAHHQARLQCCGLPPLQRYGTGILLAAYTPRQSA
jgi:hypothetical protein